MTEGNRPTPAQDGMARLEEMRRQREADVLAAQNCVDTWFAAGTYPEAELGAFKMGFTNCLEELRRLASYVGETEGLPAEAAGLEERFREFVDLFVSYMSPKPDVRRQALRRPTALRRSRGVREALRTGLTRTL